jgi:single-strand DNA-binding protein
MSINKAILVGNLGRDPEVKVTNQGVKYARFSIATSETIIDKTGQRIDNTEWHNIIVWRELAEVVEKYCRKGQMVYVEGKIRTRTWEDNGIKKNTTEIVVDNLRMLGGKRENNENTTSSPSALPNRIAEQPQSNTYNQSSENDDLPF